MRLILAGVALGVAACAPVSTTPSASQRLNALAEESFQREMDLFPIFETFLIGRGPRAGKMVEAYSDEARARQLELWRSVQVRLAGIPASELSGTDLVSRAMLERRAREVVDLAAFPGRRLWVFNQQRGIPWLLLGFATAVQPLETEADFEAWLSRIDAMPGVVDSGLKVMREDLARAFTIPRPLAAKALGQLNSLVVPPLERTALWAPVKRYPASASAEARDSWVRRYRDSLESRLLPALKRLGTFVRDEYLPGTRTTAGIGALPGGEAGYRIMVRSYTTTDLAPEEIHALGLREVARIQPKLLETARRAGFRGAMKDLSAWLESDPTNHPFKTPEEVVAYLKALHAKVLPQLPKLFHRVPKAAFDIRLVDPVLAPTSSPHYSRPSADGTKPGIFYMPVTDARKVRMSDLAAILVHEGMPGHHFDNGLKGEMDLPPFRKYGGITAFGEGWGLYSESLGHDLGVYDDPRALIGRYYLEIFRAARLVVDTGMHARGWTRERAIAYLVDETGAPLSWATTETERYMADPGQALAYKIGELTILELRDQARAALGARFDLRDFHEVVLEESHVPLALLRERVGAWIARTGRHASAFDLQGHRGARGLAPENTLPAFTKALEIGVTTLETDIAITRDGVLVIYHDQTLNPDTTRDASGAWLDRRGPAIHAIDFDTLRRYDVGRLKPGTSYANNFPDQLSIDGTRIPTLAELFELVKRSGNESVRFALETKISPLAPEDSVGPEEFAKAIVAEIRKAGMQKRTSVISFDWRTLQVVQAIAPEIGTVYITARQRWLDNVGSDNPDGSPWVAGFQWRTHGSVPRMIKAAGGKTWSVHFNDLDAAQLQEARDLGLEVLAWTVNNPDQIGRMLDLGVDGIVSDRPDRVRDEMRRRGMPLPYWGRKRMSP